MGKIRTRRRGRSPLQHAGLLGLAIFLVANAYLLLRHRGPVLDEEVPHGEGVHRWVEVELPLAARR